MKLNTLLQRLDQTVPLAFDTSLQNPEITSLQFDDDTTFSLHPTSLYLAVSADQTITLKGSVGKTAQLSLCAQMQLKNESQLAQLFDRAGCLLTSETSLQAQVNQLAIKAITAALAAFMSAIGLSQQCPRLPRHASLRQTAYR